MVRDGIFYALGFLAGGLLVSYLLNPWAGVPLFLLAAFCAWFFRDPERTVPGGPVAVSPADGKVVVVTPMGSGRTQISIFLNVFDVHVNRSPVAGVVTNVVYQKGKFLNAANHAASTDNEMNSITVTGNNSTVVFKQIAGLIARRIVCNVKPGDRVEAGQRIGLIKFGSRCDVIFGPEWNAEVRPGMRVSAGTTVLARRNDLDASARSGSAAIPSKEPAWRS